MGETRIYKFSKTDDNILSCNGVRIIESLNMVEFGEPYQEKRNWKERLFEPPLFKKYKTIFPQKVMRKFIKLLNGDLIMHPQIVSELKDYIKKNT